VHDVHLVYLPVDPKSDPYRDVLTHTTPQSGPWDEATVREMRAARVALIPTLKLWAYETRHELLEGDPASDVQAFTRVRSVLRDGRVIYEARR
jgi:hypothetical protein